MAPALPLFVQRFSKQTPSFAGIIRLELSFGSLLWTFHGAQPLAAERRALTFDMTPGEAAIAEMTGRAGWAPAAAAHAADDDRWFLRVFGPACPRIASPTQVNKQHGWVWCDILPLGPPWKALDATIVMGLAGASGNSSDEWFCPLAQAATERNLIALTCYSESGSTRRGVFTSEVPINRR